MHFEFIKTDNVVNVGDLSPGDVYQIAEAGYTKQHYIVLYPCSNLADMLDDDILSLNCDGAFCIAKNPKSRKVIKVGRMKIHN